VYNVAIRPNNPAGSTTEHGYECYHYMQNILPPSQHMGGGAGPADSVTAGPMFAVMVPERLAI